MAVKMERKNHHEEHKYIKGEGKLTAPINGLLSERPHRKPQKNVNSCTACMVVVLVP